ncbi:winged helix DNA-binding domain-containing protein [Dactylosporangium sp. NPDC048998]|uniref:winged helix DNA-binding domain-containing protein n=1 Tax=Dactylosporangium sp. NPDC048998 TaxID=3363976 RepID=UPI00371E1F10
MTTASLGARRMRAQLLAGPPARGVLDAVERVVGVQAQSWPAARLAVRARTRGLRAADVDRALASGELARTWLMRGTLHLVSAADLGWLTGLFGPLNRAAGRRRREELGVDDDTAERALAEIPGILAGAGPMDRAELVARLAGRGVRIEPTGQAPAHLVAYAAAAGVLCRGPDLAGGRPSVILAEEVRVAAAAAGGPRRGDFEGDFEGDAALRELARRYLLGYGPADAADLAAWSGLPAATARRALALLGSDPELPDVASESGASMSLPPRLLGQFDTVLLGHRDRDFVLRAEHAKRVNAGGGMVAATLLVGGEVVGLWRRTGRRLTLQPFDGPGALPAATRDALEAEAADVARFLGEPLTTAWE